MVSQKRNGFYFTSLASLLILSGCFGGKECCKSSCDTDVVAVIKDDGSEVLLTIDGKPVVTEKSFDEELKKMAEGDQQMKMMLEINPEMLREYMFGAKKQSVVIGEWAKKEGVRNSDDYKKQVNDIMKHVYDKADQDHFLKNHKVDVTDADVTKYHSENKDKDYRFLLSPAGIKTKGIEFDSKDAADKFAAELKTAGAKNIDKAAKKDNLSVRPFANVTADGYGVEEPIKDAVLNAKKYPTVLVVEDKDSKKYWVIAAISKETAKYRELDNELKEQIKKTLQPTKIKEMLDNTIPGYEKKYGVSENKEYFDKKKKSKEEEAQKAMAAAQKNDAGSKK